jgi:predicted PurR-regulated permease PerM
MTNGTDVSGPAGITDMADIADAGTDLWQIPWWLKLGGTAGWYTMGALAAFLVLGYILSTAATLTIPLLFAAILGAVFSPAVDWMAKRGVKRWLAALLVLFAVIVAFGALVALVVVGIVQQWPEISQQITETVTKAKDALHQNASPSAVNQTTDAIESSATEMLGGLAGSVGQIVSGVLAVGFALFIGANILFFMLKDGGPIGDAVSKHMFMGEALARDLLHDAGTTIRNYMVGVGIVATFNALVVGLGAVILNVPLAGTIAVVTFVFAFIPYFGAVVAGAFAVVMALSGGGAADAAIMLLIVILANGVLQTIVNMYAMNATLSLNPLLVLIVTTFGGLMFGALGAFLAAPITSIFVRTVQEFDKAGLFDRIQASGVVIAGGLDADGNGDAAPAATGGSGGAPPPPSGGDPPQGEPA